MLLHSSFLFYKNYRYFHRNGSSGGIKNFVLDNLTAENRSIWKLLISSLTLQTHEEIAGFTVIFGTTISVRGSYNFGEPMCQFTYDILQAAADNSNLLY
jgi:hypothetical protein